MIFLSTFCFRRFGLLVATLLLAGCMAGSNFEKPASPEGASYSKQPLHDPEAPAETSAGGTQHLVSGKEIHFDWWKSLGSPQLNRLINKSIEANPNIDAAKAALRQAQELTLAQKGFFYPSVSGGYTLTRQQVAGNVANSSAPGVQANGRVILPLQSTTPPFNSSLTWTMQTAQLSVGYTPDVFGLNRRTVESLDAQAQMQRFQLEAAYITLASSVVAGAVGEASLRGQISAAKKVIEENTKMVELLRQEVGNGYASRIDLAAQESQLAQVTATLPPLLKQLAQQRNLLTALAGRLPGQEPEETFEIALLHLPCSLPLSLPSKIIEQRPDVRAAEENMHSANAQVGVAIANRLPQFTINGSMSGTATVFSQLLSTGAPGWSFAPSVAQPLFAGFTLLHRQRAAGEALKQAEAQYRSTVITAFQNVADTLHALEQDGDALKAALAAEHAAKVTLDLTTHQYQVGYANYLALLSAEQTYQQAAINLVQAQANRLGDTGALFLALGGGWWNR